MPPALLLAPLLLLFSVPLLLLLALLLLVLSVLVLVLLRFGCGVRLLLLVLDGQRRVPSTALRAEELADVPRLLLGDVDTVTVVPLLATVAPSAAAGRKERQSVSYIFTTHVGYVHHEAAGVGTAADAVELLLQAVLPHHQVDLGLALGQSILLGNVLLLSKRKRR